MAIESQMPLGRCLAWTLDSLLLTLVEKKGPSVVLVEGPQISSWVRLDLRGWPTKKESPSK